MGIMGIILLLLVLLFVAIVIASSLVATIIRIWDDFTDFPEED